MYFSSVHFHLNSCNAVGSQAGGISRPLLPVAIMSAPAQLIYWVSFSFAIALGWQAGAFHVLLPRPSCIRHFR